MDPENLGWVKSSSYRQRVLKSLEEEDMMMPSEIADRTDRHLSHISNTLSELEERQLIECLTPDLKKGRLYSLTEDGVEIVEHLDT